MTDFILIILGILLFASVIFIITHLRPLTVKEIESLASKWRKNQIRFYYSYNNSPIIPDSEFKKRMNSAGKFYKINEPLDRFPMLAAALLKYKKHEWIIIGFEKGKMIDLMWLNKGINRANVWSHLTLQQIIVTAKIQNSSSILIFHNHPNSNPNYYSFKKPSDQDIRSAAIFKEDLNPAGINLVEFVCE